MRKSVFAMLALTLFSIALQASPEPTRKDRQTPWGLYVDAKEAFDMKMALGNDVLFVDVRDPIEIMFTGFTNIVDVNIPFKLADRTAWNPKKPVFLMRKNSNFEADIAGALEVRGLSKDTPIILMCRSGGTRGAPSAMELWEQGYKAVYVVTDGFEGGSLKEDDRGPWRLKSGWKNSNLPWSYQLNPDKMYMAGK